MLFLRRLLRIIATLPLLFERNILVDTPRLASVSTATRDSAISSPAPRLYSQPAYSMASAAEEDPLPTEERDTCLATHSSTATKPSDHVEASSSTPKLPPLSRSDFQTYNHMATHMDMYHSHFRTSWNLLWSACVSSKRPSHLSLRSFINTGLQFCRHLTLHHDIEETYIFPVLARKMPEFQTGKEKGKNGGGELVQQHREIHKGLEQLEDYLQRCKNGEVELELSVLKTKMESWGNVLWTHLDEEVKTLGAENMRKYWTLEEMREMPM